MNSAHLTRAQLLIEQQRYPMAEQELRQAIGVEPQDPVAHALLGLCLVRQGNKCHAVEACERAIHLGPDLPFCHYALAGVLYEADRLDEALSAIAQAIRLDPHEPAYHALRGQIHLHRRDWSHALAAAEEALAIDAENVDAANVRAVALTNLGRRDEAGATIDAALARDPENATSHANRGWTLLHSNRPKEAMAHFAEALRLEPGSEWARAGIVEAMKARNPIYRVLLLYFLHMSRLKPRTQLLLLVGLLVGVNVVGGIGRANPQLEPVADAVLVAYAAIVFSTWMAQPLFNLLLRLNRFGRLALSDQQRSDSTWLGLAILAVGLFMAIELPRFGFWLAMPYLFLLLPVSATLAVEPRQGRRAMSLLTAALFVAAVVRLWIGFADVPAAEDNGALYGYVAVYLGLGRVLTLGSAGATWLSGILQAR